MIWYYRRNREIAGPIPLPAIERYLILGRLGLNDEVRQDDGPWIRIRNCPELESTCKQILEGSEEALAVAKRYADERNHARRSANRAEKNDLRRRERRASEPQQIVELRANRKTLFEPRKERSWMGYLLIACIVVLALAAVLFYQPVNPIKIGLPGR